MQTLGASSQVHIQTSLRSWERVRSRINTNVIWCTWAGLSVCFLSLLKFLCWRNVQIYKFFSACVFATFVCACYVSLGFLRMRVRMLYRLFVNVVYRHWFVKSFSLFSLTCLAWTPFALVVSFASFWHVPHFIWCGKP